MLMKEVYSVSPVFLLVYENSRIIGGQLFFDKSIFFFLRSYESQGGPLVINEKDFEAVEAAILENYQKIRRLNFYILTRPKLSGNSNLRYHEAGFLKSDFFTFLKAVVFLNILSLPIAIRIVSTSSDERGRSKFTSSLVQ